MALVEIARFSDITEAQAAAAALRASNIPVMLQNEFHGHAMFYMSQALGGFRLWTPEADAADARAFIEACRGEPRRVEVDAYPAVTLLAVITATLLGPIIGWTFAAARLRRRRLPDDGSED